MITVYTKTGDEGESGLANGKRVSKADPIFDVLGTLDELNSHLGLCVTSINKLSSSSPPAGEAGRKRSASASGTQFILTIQDTLFHIGAELAGSSKTKLAPGKIVELEKEIDRLQEGMGENWYQKFLLPGGCEAAAHLDIARTVCRRLERVLVSYAESNVVPADILKYINRLSDYLYVLRCHENLKNGEKEKVFILSS